MPNSVKIFSLNSSNKITQEQYEREINSWLKNHESKIDVINILFQDLSGGGSEWCYAVLIWYKEK